MASLTETLAASWYYDAGHHEDEIEEIFSKTWQWAGHSTQVEDVGAYFQTEVAGRSLLVVRGEDGVLRAFHNACRHRAGPMRCAKEGRAKSFRCAYHGWVYGLDGGLKKASALDLVDELKNLSLFPVSVDTWRCFIFINLDPAAKPLMDFVGSAEKKLEPFAIDGFKKVEQSTHPLACNWKTYVDNYAEGYHIPYLHPRLSRAIDCSQYQVTNFEHYSVHEAPEHSGERARALWLWMWPNLALNIYPHGMNVERVVPLGPERCQLEYTYYFRDPSAAHVQDDIAFSSEVTAEDIEVCERVQRNLKNSPYQKGWLHPEHENGNVFFQKLVRKALLDI